MSVILQTVYANYHASVSASSRRESPSRNTPIFALALHNGGLKSTYLFLDDADIVLIKIIPVVRYLSIAGTQTTSILAQWPPRRRY